jgi:hypothetical protein
MALCGEMGERLDCAIFADTGWEPSAVYRHLDWLEAEASRYGLPVYRVSAGDLRQDLLDAVSGKRKRVANPPFFVRTSDYRGGMLRRSCTSEYKVTPIRRRVRQLAEVVVASRRLPSGCVEQWFGISFDEWRRMRTSDVGYVTHRYPLVERRLTRADCLAWLRRHGYPEPPKSACIGCPYHTNDRWHAMKRDRPEEWADAVHVDRVIRRGVPGVTGQVYLHRSLLPLDLVSFGDDREQAQPHLPGFEDECSGHCGV